MKKRLPDNFDYQQVSSLSNEVRAKLMQVRLKRWHRPRVFWRDQGGNIGTDGLVEKEQCQRSYNRAGRIVSVETEKQFVL